MANSKSSGGKETPTAEDFKEAIEVFRRGIAGGLSDGSIDPNQLAAEYTPQAKTLPVHLLASYHVTEGELERLTTASERPRISSISNLMLGGIIGSAVGGIAGIINLFRNYGTYFQTKPQNAFGVAEISPSLNGSFVDPVDLVAVILFVSFIIVQACLYITGKAWSKSETVNQIVETIKIRHDPDKEAQNSKLTTDDK